MATEVKRIHELAPVEELLNANPLVDGEKLAEGLETLDKLRQIGLERPDYKLASPYGHAGVHSADEREWH